MLPPTYVFCVYLWASVLRVCLRVCVAGRRRSLTVTGEVIWAGASRAAVPG